MWYFWIEAMVWKSGLLPVIKREESLKLRILHFATGLATGQFSVILFIRISVSPQMLLRYFDKEGNEVVKTVRFSMTLFSPLFLYCFTWVDHLKSDAGGGEKFLFCTNFFCSPRGVCFFPFAQIFCRIYFHSTIIIMHHHHHFSLKTAIHVGRKTWLNYYFNYYFIIINNY